MPRLLVTASQVRAAREQARLDARAALTARLAELEECGALLAEACLLSTPATVDELVEMALTAVRMAGVALQADAVDVLAALLVGRAAVEQATGREG
jgi:hypothetical protein